MKPRFVKFNFDPLPFFVVRGFDCFGSDGTLKVVDLDNGNYEVRFTPTSPGTYCLNVFIFARPIKVDIVVVMMNNCSILISDI